MKTHESPPPRLVDDSGPVADWLRHALAEERGEPPVPRFSALQQLRVRRVRARVAIGTLLVAAMAVGAWWLAPLRGEPAPLARAEPLGTPNVDEHRAVEARALEAEPDVVAPELRAPEAARPASADRSGGKRGAPTRLGGTKQTGEPADAKPASPVSEPTRTARDCAALARDAAAEDAMSCYGELAAGSGVTAELALFEQARLAGKVLRQPARALVSLDDYQRRFPRGSLRAEVQLARIDWLLALGDKLAARRAVQEALDSGLLHEREAELRRLRDSLPPLEEP